MIVDPPKDLPLPVLVKKLTHQVEFYEKETQEDKQEISRLRAALEKYADEYNWIMLSSGFEDTPLVRYMNGHRAGNKELAIHPWLLAQEALNGD